MGGSPLTSPGHAWVDARDVAEAHVRSLEVEAAGGERIMICAGQMVWQDWSKRLYLSALDACDVVSVFVYQLIL